MELSQIACLFLPLSRSPWVSFNLSQRVAAATFPYASDIGDKLLAGRVSFSRTDLLAGRDATISARCHGIYAAANSMLAALAVYEVTPDDLDLLENRINFFDAVQTKPRQSTSSGGGATKQLPNVFTKATGILNDRLTGLMLKFTASQPVFVGEYQAARHIVDPGSRAQKAAPAPNALPQSKAA